VVWLQSLPLSQVLFLHVQALKLDPKATLTERHRLILHSGLWRNVRQWRLYEGVTCGACAEGAVTECPSCGQPLCETCGVLAYCPDCVAKVQRGEPLIPLPARLRQPDPPAEGDLVSLFECADQVSALGDPTMPDTAANGLLDALTMASGWPQHVVDPGSDKPAADYETWHTGLTGDGGRWVAGLFDDPTHEVYLQPMDEPTRDLAQQRAGAADVCDTEQLIPMRGTPYIIEALLRSGPGGDQVLTQEQARSLPYGLAQAIALQTYRMVPTGGSSIRAARFREQPALGDATGGGGLPPVVPAGEGDATEHSAGSDAADGDDVDRLVAEDATGA